MAVVPEPCPPEITLSGTITLGEVEVTNDVGNPIPVIFSPTSDPTHAEDTPAATGDIGSFLLGVRNDNNAVTTSADGDYSQISTDSTGRAKVNVDTEVASSFQHGANLDVDSGAAEQIVVVTTPAKHSVLIRAAKANTGTLYIGNSSGVTATNGMPLDHGESIELPIDNANKVWVIASADNQALAWVAI